MFLIRIEAEGLQVLTEFLAEGVDTNIDFPLNLLRDKEFLPSNMTVEYFPAEPGKTLSKMFVPSDLLFQCSRCQQVTWMD